MSKVIVCNECGKIKEHKAHGLCNWCYSKKYLSEWRKAYYREYSKKPHMRKYYNKWQKQEILRRKENGQCVWIGCYNNFSDDSLYCAYHAEVRNKKRKDRRNDRKLKGYCSEDGCESILSIKSKCFCDYHLDKYNKMSMKLHKNKTLNGICYYCGGKINPLKSMDKCDSCFEKYAKSSKQKYIKLKALRKCIRCGKNLDGSSICYCLDCGIKQRIHSKTTYNGFNLYSLNENVKTNENKLGIKIIGEA